MSYSRRPEQLQDAGYIPQGKLCAVLGYAGTTKLRRSYPIGAKETELLSQSHLKRSGEYRRRYDSFYSSIGSG
jgi:hypothetical protein